MCKISAGSADSSQIFLENSYTYLQNVCKLFTDIIQIREKLLQITAVLSQICYRYSQTFNKQLLDEVEHDTMNYQSRGLCYLPKPKAEADNTDTRV